MSGGAVRNGPVFRARRLGHVNIFVEDLETSVAFYRDVIGLPIVYEEVDLRGVFFSKGNTHHDLALFETSSAGRLGKDGELQIDAGRGAKRGLNHVGLEVENEEQLVASIERAKAMGISIEALKDHQISHSAYLRDPDGNGVEYYCDTDGDWRELFRAFGTGLITSKWVIPTLGDASRARNYGFRSVEVADERNSTCQVIRTARVGLAVTDLDVASRFWTEVGGFSVLESGRLEGVRYCFCCGSYGEYDLCLFEHALPGLVYFSMALSSLPEEDAFREAVGRGGGSVTRWFGNSGEPSVWLRCPEGYGLQLFVEGEGSALGASEERVEGAAPFLGRGRTWSASSA